MKIVLDTNVLLVSISRRSRYHPVFQAFENKRFSLFVTTDILLEYEETIGWHMGAETAKNVLEGLLRVSNLALIQKFYYWQLVTADPDDDKFVDCAVASNADFLVTNDGHFNVLKKIPFPKVEILNADDFLELLANQQEQAH